MTRFKKIEIGNNGEKSVNKYALRYKTPLCITQDKKHPQIHTNLFELVIVLSVDNVSLKILP